MYVIKICLRDKEVVLRGQTSSRQSTRLSLHSRTDKQTYNHSFFYIYKTIPMIKNREMIFFNISVSLYNYRSTMSGPPSKRNVSISGHLPHTKPINRQVPPSKHQKPFNQIPLVHPTWWHYYAILPSVTTTLTI